VSSWNGEEASAVKVVVRSVGVAVSNGARSTSGSGSTNSIWKLATIGEVSIAFIEARSAVRRNLANTTGATNAGNDIRDLAADLTATTAIAGVSGQVDVATILRETLAKRPTSVTSEDFADTEVALLGQSLLEVASIVAATAGRDVVVGVDLTTVLVVVVAVLEAWAANDAADTSSARSGGSVTKGTRDSAVVTTRPTVRLVDRSLRLTAVGLTNSEGIAILVTSVASRVGASAGNARYGSILDVGAVVTATTAVGRIDGDVGRATNTSASTAVQEAGIAVSTTNTSSAIRGADMGLSRASDVATTAVRDVIGQCGLATVGGIAVAVIEARLTREAALAANALGASLNVVKGEAAVTARTAVISSAREISLATLVTSASQAITKTSIARGILASERGGIAFASSRVSPGDISTVSRAITATGIGSI
jgi:hypothetical protein